MKTLKIILIALAVIIIPLVAALFVSRTFNYEKTIRINAPVDQVWNEVSTFSAMSRWTPWKDHDPNMRVQIKGTDGTVGAEQIWTSGVEEVGSGSQTITKIQPPTLFETKLVFHDPYENEADGYVRLDDRGGGKTLVAWGFKSELPYPMNVTRLFVDMEGMMDGDFTRGLRNLKELCER